MRHRAPTILSRARDLTQRRGLAAGAVTVLGVSACAGLVAVNGHDFSPGDAGSVTAGVFPDLRTGTTYPDAAALETMASERSDAAANRGDARTSPSDKVSEAPDPQAAAPAPSAATPTPEPASPQAGDDEPRQSADPTPSDPAGSSPSPSSPESSSPDPEESGSSTAPAPAPATGPETTAVTDLAAAGTWTVVLTSDTVASFECSLDGGAWTACGPVATFTGLSKGKHTLAVRAIDGSGTPDSTPAQLSTTLNGSVL
ncbi:hypothetical protein [Nocardioides iriomotensis]|uniref:Bacterial Ig-like domain-containing protein n=1 Tax=Nocardioides iriomotensis TaxID=715784 RepID=A0A4V1Z148_9ACTN|nr:hypothetical protein [Nocardioides iriomotensis]RYU09656.1 hypothetical protein ETU37_21745 [Nocardioides iriomotensis]